MSTRATPALRLLSITCTPRLSCNSREYWNRFDDDTCQYRTSMQRVEFSWAPAELEDPVNTANERSMNGLCLTDPEHVRRIRNRFP